MNLYLENIELTEADLMEVNKAFSNPSVIKYLRRFGQEDAKELLGLAALDMPADKLNNRHQFVSGKLIVIDTLLSISQTERT